jgi:peptidoglycan hydrolase-like protein with peptidoglycan-binding domain
MVSSPNAHIAALGSYFALAARLATPARTTALPIAAAPSATAGPLRMGSPAVDRLDTGNSGASAGTIDDIEGTIGGGALPTDLEALPATYGSAESTEDGPTTASVSSNRTAGRVLREGVSGADVAAIQRSLAAAGFTPGPADGFMGSRTTAAVKRFQAAKGLPVDGEIGPRTRAGLLGGSEPAAPARQLRTHAAASREYAAKAVPATPGTTGGHSEVQSKLVRHLNNPYRGRVHQCFRYAWTMATTSGGHSIDNARVSYAGRNAQIGYLNSLIKQGKLATGDVVYVNRRPGADPSSTIRLPKPRWHN